jgi:hypothetical protein
MDWIYLAGDRHKYRAHVINFLITIKGEEYLGRAGELLAYQEGFCSAESVSCFNLKSVTLNCCIWVVCVHSLLTYFLVRMRMSVRKVEATDIQKSLLDSATLEGQFHKYQSVPMLQFRRGKPQ